MQFLTDDIEEYIKDLIEKFKEQNIYQPIVDSLSKQMFAPEQTNDFNSNLNQDLTMTKPLEGYVTNNRILNDPSKPIFIENDYKHSPTIQNQPSPIMSQAPKRPIENVLKPAVQNVANNINETVDKAFSWTLKKAVKDVFPTSSDMYTDSMTDFSRAKQNPNAEIINFKDVKDEKMKDILRQYKTKEDERGVHYDSNSKTSELFSNSPEIQKIKKEYHDKIKSGETTELPVKFDSNILKDLFNGNLKKIDRHTSIQHGRLTNLKIDKDDNMTGDLIDRQDYEKRKYRSPFDVSTMLNNHGYKMQEKGDLENNFSVIDILTKDKEEEKEDLIKKLLRFFGR